MDAFYIITGVIFFLWLLNSSSGPAPSKPKPQEKLRCWHCNSTNGTIELSLRQFPYLVQFKSGKTGHKFCYCEKCMVQLQAEYHKALLESEKVEYFSKNYKGKTPRTGPKQEIWSNYLDNRDDALKQVTVTAAYLGYDVLTGVSYSDITQSVRTEGGGIFHKKVWAAGALCAKKS